MPNSTPIKGIGCYRSSFIQAFLIPQLKKHNIHIIPYPPNYKKEKYDFGIFDHTYSMEEVKHITRAHTYLPWFLLAYTRKSRNHFNALDYGIDVIIALPCRIEYIAKIIKNVVHKTQKVRENLRKLAFYENNKLGLKLIEHEASTYLNFDKELIRLTPLEGLLVKLIIKRLNQGIRFLDYETLFHYTKVKHNTLKTAMSLLRRKLKQCQIPLLIKNEYGVGYRLIPYSQ